MDHSATVAHLLEDLKLAISEEDIALSTRVLLALQSIATKIGPSQPQLQNMEAQNLMTLANDILNSWRDEIGEGQYMDVFSAKDQKWYSAKILSRDEDKMTIHYLQWQSKYDETVELSSLMFYPRGTVTGKYSRKADVKLESAPEEASAEPVSQPTDIQKPVLTSRSGRVITTAAAIYCQPASKPKRQISPSKKRAEQPQDINDWICGICWLLEAAAGSSLVLCDGPCLRSFHTECLESVPLDMENWYCKDCLSGRHQCFLCNEYGEDNIDVCRCSVVECGKYYHAECLSTDTGNFLCPQIKWNKEDPTDNKVSSSSTHSAATGTTTTASSCSSPEGSSLVDSAASPAPKSSTKKVKSSSEDPTVPAKTLGIIALTRLKWQSFYSSAVPPAFSFKCSYHVCDTCHAFYPNERGVLLSCIRCPRSFHENCIPPGARFNALALLCQLHTDCVLPTELGKGQLQTGSFVKLWEQMVLPETCPSASEVQDNHFFLPVAYRSQVEDEPRHFKTIQRLNMEFLTAKGKTVPFHAQEEQCDCVNECDYRCINRLLSIECHDKICGVKKSDCGNRSFTNRKFPKSERIREEGMGWGLRAGEDIGKGDLVIEYLGEIIDHEEMVKRFDSQHKNSPSDKDYYVMELENNLYVDGKHMGNESRFINHSCGPNCELQLWLVKGHMRIGIVALRDIAAGEPLSYDYQFDTNERNVFNCYCKTSKCRGTMAPKRKVTRVTDIAALSFAERQKLLGEAKYSLETSYARRVQEEWTYSLTDKTLPGDSASEIKIGPSKCLAIVREHDLYLPRNARVGQNFLARRKRLIAKTKRASNSPERSSKRK